MTARAWWLRAIISVFNSADEALGTGEGGLGVLAGPRQVS
jgi:hypothetical protein